MRRRKWEFKNGKYQPTLLEEHVLTEIVTRLWLQKIKVFRIRERIPGKGRLSTPGLPDLMGWIPQWWVQKGLPAPLYKALPLFIECKRPGGARRPAQIRFIDEAKSDGCVAFFAESWHDCVREFEAVGITLREDA